MGDDDDGHDGESDENESEDDQRRGEEKRREGNSPERKAALVKPRVCAIRREGGVEVKAGPGVVIVIILLFDSYYYSVLVDVLSSKSTIK